ncbi:ATP-binding cassette domain-containing protein [Gemmatimonas sp.]|uniref:ATP-binding cassette domain-containing protein n=1 Tax=Gemmatimonas sp. TaxID=1962908 RepID=UPI0039830E92
MTHTASTIPSVLPYALSAEAVGHAYGTQVTLHDVTLQVPEGQVVALVGESGSGKTTLLRCFNALLRPSSGRVRVHGADVSSMRPELLRREIGFVPQAGGLLPHWTVLRNAALVPQLTGHAKPEAAATAALEAVGLPAGQFGKRFPHELSGGQRQRVALARALAAKQSIVLLDEPFGALDAISRAEMHAVFADVRAELGFTAILVTHDLGEAARLADLIAVMRAGRIEQIGPLASLRTSPATPYVSMLLAQADAAQGALAGHV